MLLIIPINAHTVFDVVVDDEVQFFVREAVVLCVLANVAACCPALAIASVGLKRWNIIQIGMLPRADDGSSCDQECKGRLHNVLQGSGLHPGVTLLLFLACLCYRVPII